MTDHDLRHPATRRRRGAGPALIAGLVSAAVGLALASPAEAQVAPSPAEARAALVAKAKVGPTTYSEPGPYGVGETTLKLRNGSPVEVWYPARKADVAGKPMGEYDMVEWLPLGIQGLLPDGFELLYPSGGVRGVPVARGRFPVVVFSHGFAGFRDQSSFLTAWLASWGFIVAAPDHESRDLTAVLLSMLGGPPPEGQTTDVQDLGATLSLMQRKADQKSNRFHGHLDRRYVGALGHSAGGAASEAWAATDPRVTTFVAMAGATVGAFGESEDGPGSIVPKVPGLIMAGRSDKVVSAADLQNAYSALRKPKRYVEVGGGHHAFSDICEVGASAGGLLAVADAIGFPVPERLARLAADGCNPPALPPTEAWPAIRHVTVAYLRHVFGFDRTDAALRGLVKAYPGVVKASRSAG